MKTVDLNKESRSTSSKQNHHPFFVLGMLVVTFGVLIGLFLAVGDHLTPASYTGLLGFPKIGTLASKADGDVIAFVFAFIVGFLIQRSRWCNASAIRDAILFKSFRNTKPLLAAMMVVTTMFTIFEAIHVGQPISIIGGAFTVLGLFLFGIGMVLGGSCTVSVWIRSAEGSASALVALLYTFIGMFLFSELWNLLRWPPANYLQTTKPNLSILSFGSFNALTIRSMFGSFWGPVAVLVAGGLQVLILGLLYRKFVRIERAAHQVQITAATAAATATANLTAASKSDKPMAAPDVLVGSFVGAGAELDSGVPGDMVRSLNEIYLEPWGDIHVDKVLDCSGEMCPRPQLFTKKAIVKEMAVGQVLELVVDNPSSPELVPTIMDSIGASFLGTIRGDHDWKLYIRKETER